MKPSWKLQNDGVRRTKLTSKFTRQEEGFTVIPWSEVPTHSTALDPALWTERRGSVSSVRFCMVWLESIWDAHLSAFYLHRVCGRQPAVMVLPSTITKSPVCEKTLGYAMFIFFLSIKIFMISWLKIRKSSIMRFHRASDFCIKRFTTKYWKHWFETLGHSDYINGRWGKWRPIWSKGSPLWCSPT